MNQPPRPGYGVEAREIIILRSRLRAIFEAATEVNSRVKVVAQRLADRLAAGAPFPEPWLIDEIHLLNEEYNLVFEGEGISLLALLLTPRQ